MRDIIPPNFNRFPDEGLKIISHCPVCHYNYNPVEAKVLEESDDAHLIYIKCRRCQSAILALVLANAFGVSSIGLITDLDSQEVAKFKELEAVSGDDVLSVYESLQNGSLEGAVL